MATYDDLTSSVESSRPIEVYNFALGADNFLYTSWSQDVTVAADTYSAVTISRNQLSQGSDQRNRDVIITVASSNEFAAKYVNVVPGQKATLSIINLQPDEAPAFDTQALVFKGQVQSVRFPDDGSAAEIVVRSIEAAKSQNIPRVSYMAMCNHFLYDNGCGVNPSLFDLLGTVTAGGTTAQITVAGAGGEADGYWTGGYVTTTVGEQDFRMVIAHTGDVLTLLLPFASDVSGSTVQIFAGCDHKLTSDCSVKFQNAIEFGGFAFVPKKNIFRTGLD